MKNRLTVAIASLIVASMGSVAFAQTTPQTPPQMPPPPTSSPYPTNSSQSDQNMPNQSMSNQSMSNDQIAQQVKRQLQNDGISSDDNLMVSVQNGTASLSGTVDSQQDINKIRTVAMQVRGVKHVDTSGLQVQGSAGQGR